MGLCGDAKCDDRMDDQAIMREELHEDCPAPSCSSMTRSYPETKLQDT